MAKKSGKKAFFEWQDGILLGTILAVFFVDRLTKYLLADSCIWQLCIRREINFGAAFGIFPGQTLLFVIAAILVLFVIASAYRDSDRLTKIALALIAAGTISNLFDRLFYGYVQDVFAVFGSSSFNIADLSNFAGALFLIVSITRAKKK